MKRIFTILLATFPVFATFAQNSFQLAIGGSGEETCSDVVSANNRYHFFGHTTTAGSGSYDVFYVMTDTNGTVLRSSIAGLAGEEIALAATAHGKGCAAVGYTTSFGYQHPFFVLYNTEGNIVRTGYYPIHGWGYGICTSKDGGFLITGRHDFAFGTGNENIFLLKTDSVGNVAWARSFGDTLINEGRQVIQAGDGSIYISGFTHIQNGGPLDIVLLKLDKDGNFLWSRKYGYHYFGWDFGYTLATLGNDILICGAGYTDAFSPWSEDGIIIHTDAGGNIKHSFALGTPGYDQVRDIITDANGRFTIVGLTTASGKSDVLMCTLDTNGTIYQQRVAGGTNFDNGLAVSKHGNSFLFGGYTDSYGNGANDMYILKVPASFNSCNQDTTTVKTKPVTLSSQPYFADHALIAGGAGVTFNEVNTGLGKTILCQTTQVNDEELAHDYRLFPNPASDRVSILCNNPEKLRTVAVYDIAGRIVGKWQFAPGKEINFPVSSFPTGTYLVEVISDTDNKRLILNKW